MRRFGRLNAGFPGMGIQALTPALADALGVGGTEGGVVTEMTPDSPAEKAGVRIGDVVLRIGREHTPDARAMLRQLARFPPGSVAPVELWRAGRTLTVDLTLVAFPPQYRPGRPAGDGRSREAGHFATARAAVGGDVRRRPQGLPPDHRPEWRGDRGGRRQQYQRDAGLASGDVIERVQDAPASSPEEVTDLLAKAREQGHATVPMLVRSRSRLQWLAIPLGEL